VRRLRRRFGVLLASLGVAIGALVAPVSTAPAQANHITEYDNTDVIFHQDGSWWYAEAWNCFTTNLEYLHYIKIRNDGSQPHKFRWKWQTYGGGTVAWDETTWRKIDPGDSWTWFPAPDSTFGALLQSGHPRVKIYWVNNSGVADVLFELHAWSTSGWSGKQPMGPNGGDCS